MNGSWFELWIVNPDSWIGSSLAWQSTALMCTILYLATVILCADFSPCLMFLIVGNSWLILQLVTKVHKLSSTCRVTFHIPVISLQCWPSIPLYTPIYPQIMTVSVLVHTKIRSLYFFRSNAKFLWKRIPQPVKTVSNALDWQYVTTLFT